MSETQVTLACKKGYRISYVNVDEPRLNDLSGKEEYSCTVLIPKSDATAIKALKNAARAVIKKKFGNSPPKLNKPGLRDGDTYFEEDPTNRGPETKGHYFIRCKSTRPPKLLNHRKEPAKPGEILSGYRCAVIVNAYAFDRKGSKGYSFGLQALMLTAKDAPLGGVMSDDSAREAFGDVKVDTASFEDSDPLADETAGEAEEDGDLLGGDESEDDDLV